MSVNCSWTGYPCDCTSFPYKEDGLIPAKCEQRITLDMIPLRSVNPKLKALHKQYLRELELNTYDHEDPKWGLLLRDAKRGCRS
jgi:hypothetical protein